MFSFTWFREITWSVKNSNKQLVFGYLQLLCLAQRMLWKDSKSDCTTDILICQTESKNLTLMSLTIELILSFEINIHCTS